MVKKNITFHDIAQYTGFSKTTISRYFNHPDSLTLENQKKIANALKELNYHENKVARILANGKTEFIGVIIPNLYLHYYSTVLNEILSTYEKFGYKFIVFAGDNHEETEQKYMKELFAYKIEGMIVLSHTIPSEELASYGIPVVTIEREDRYTNSVNTDNYLGGVQATEMLYEADCDIYIHINSALSEDMPSYGRIKGFSDTCKKYQLENRIFSKDLGNNHENIKNYMIEFLDIIDKMYPNKRKGIFMPNDTYANILCNLLIQKCKNIPDEYCIVGFDNSPISGEAIIPISTIGQQIDKIACSAMEILIAQINERKKKRPIQSEGLTHKVIPPIPIPRETTKTGIHILKSGKIQNL
ncbi:MAG: LacI family DNA-binding transcriptional regulator [Lachnospiraceae bacterium]|nr:LacI family DNA-binding transcriptional regulator [Lachnospiraceae bacterium]